METENPSPRTSELGIRNSLRSARGSPKRNTRNPWASKRSATASGGPAESTAIRARNTRTPRRRNGRASSRTSGRSGTRSRGEEERRQVISHIVLFRPRPTLTADQRQALTNALRARRRGHSADQARHDRQAPPARTVLAMKHKWPSTMSTRPSSSSIPKRTYARISIIPAHNDLGTLLFTSAEAVLAYDFRSGLAEHLGLRRCGAFCAELESRTSVVIRSAIGVASECALDRAHQARLIADVVELFEQLHRFGDRR